MIDQILVQETVTSDVYGKVVLETGQVVTAPVQAVVLSKRQEDGVLTIVYTALMVVLLLLYFVRKKGRKPHV